MVRTRRVVVRFLHRTEYPSSTSSLICLIGMIFDATVGCFEKRDVTLSRSTANRQTSVIKMTEMRTTRLVFLLDWQSDASFGCALHSNNLARHGNFLFYILSMKWLNMYVFFLKNIQYTELLYKHLYGIQRMLPYTFHYTPA